VIPDDLKPVRWRLFSKLALVFCLSAVAVLSAVAGFFGPPHPPRGGRGGMRANMLFHVNDMADRMGMPPRHEVAQKLSEDLGLKIRIEGPEAPWSSSPNLLPTENFEASANEEMPGGARAGRLDGSFFLLLKRGDYHFLFVFPGNPDSGPGWRGILQLLALLAAILALSYFMVTWLLKPLSSLVTGVEEITAGNLNYNLDVGHGHDEFRNLGGAFNQMTAKVREMLKAKERLLLDVSHELRSPLARIKVALALLPKSSEKKSLERAASEMEVMLAEILESERLKSSHGSLSKSPLSLPILAAEIAELYSGQAPGIKVAKPKSFPVLNLDEAKLRTVLKNVIENALKYSGDSKKAVELSFDEDERWARVKIKDYGQGIPQEDLGLVFEPFYRVDKSRTKKTGGYGLGLSLCREIVQAHGGEILISSKLEQGTELSLQFPKSKNL
jgi:signal transduction histidine kinase